MSDLFRFQSTLPRGERPRFSAVVGINFNISIHAPARGATDFTTSRRLRINISIHAPARGATLSIASITPTKKFQSTLPRGERPARGATSCTISAITVNTISIHAPARGATFYGWKHWGLLFISIHAPARGATSNFSAIAGEQKNFNPRSREGSDRVL